MRLLAALLPVAVACAGQVLAADVDFTLRIDASSSRFAIGEVIPLELRFNSSIPKRYRFDNASYDRSGRLEIDEFHVLPKEGTSDPLAMYFKSIGGFLRGGLRGMPLLGVKPEVIHCALNEWVRIDRPGPYRLSVLSHRVKDLQDANSPMGKPVPLTSNEVQFEVVAADSAEQAARLTSIRAILDASPLTGPAQPSGVKSAREKAIEELRYLGTKEAAVEMVRRLRNDDPQTNWPFGLGLAGSPNRAAGLAEMKSLLAEADFPVTGAFLHFMLPLELNAEAQPGEFPKTRESVIAGIRSQLLTGLANKRGRARITSLNTALGVLGRPEDAAARGRVLSSLMESFPDLPIADRLNLLNSYWPSIREPALIPVLRRTFESVQEAPGVSPMMASRAEELEGVALKRWYELDPAGARVAILAEIAKPMPRFDASVLGILPDAELPELASAIVSNFTEAEDGERTSSLLARYVTKAELPRVVAWLDPRLGRYACRQQNNVLAYVLRVEPATARPLIERALAARGPGKNACRIMLFSDIAAWQASPLLEDLAIAHLNDEDLQVVLDAVLYLGHHGSAAAEEPLWRRYEAWSKKWTGRAGELSKPVVEMNPTVWETSLGRNLEITLATGQGWFAGRPALSHIAELAVTTGDRSQIDSYLAAWQATPFRIGCEPPLYPDGEPKFTLVQYAGLPLAALKAKLAQFPSGSRFLLIPPGTWNGVDRNDSPEVSAAFSQITVHAQMLGFEIGVESARKMP
jgi:hypothetical protein